MRIRNYLPLAAAALVGAAVLGTPTRADASFQMKLISSSAGTLTISDGGPGDSLNTLGAGTPDGGIIFMGSWGAYNIQVNTGESKPILGGAANPEMDLNYSITRTAGGAPETLTLEISDTDFTTSPIGMNMLYGGTNGSGVTSSFLAGTGLNNTEFNTGDANGTVGPFGSGAFSGTSGFGVPNNSGNYSLTISVTIVNNGSTGVSSGDANINAVPAPAGLLLAATGLPMLGFGTWIRRRRAAAQA